MIPSRNAGIEVRAKKLYDAWLPQYKTWEKAAQEEYAKTGYSAKCPENLAFSPKVPITCDCCGSVYEESSSSFVDVFGQWEPGHVYWKGWRGFLEVAGTVYFGCQTACAQAIFMIHHQYAMRAQSDEGRFVQGVSNMERGGQQTVDLDRVVSVSERNHGVIFHLERGDDIYFDTWYQKDPEKAVAEYIAAWKKRRVRPEIV